jgi:putative tricarboxylic transport membrane protein
MRIARNKDLWSGLALAALGGYIVVTAVGWPYMTEEGPGPGFFPRWYGGLMIALSLVLVAGSALRAAPSQAPKPVEWAELGRALGCWLAFVASIALMPVLGFAISFALLTWFIVAVLARRPHRIALALAIGGSALFYGIFELGLDLSLPHGMLF